MDRTAASNDQTAGDSRLSAGLRKAAPIILPTVALGVSFGILARPVMGLVAPAILTGLVLYETLTGKHAGIAVDARLVGLLVAVAAALRRLPMIVTVILAATATAVTRLVI